MATRKFAPVHPGAVLAEDFLKAMDISQYRLAKAIGVPPRRINGSWQARPRSRSAERYLIHLRRKRPPDLGGLPPIGRTLS